MVLAAVVVAALVALAMGVGVFGLRPGLERALELVAERGPVPFVLAVAGLATFGVPRAALAVVGALAFGMWPGALLAWLASLLSALLGFTGGRVLLPPLVARRGASRPAALGSLRLRLAGLPPTGRFASGWAVLLARLSPLPFWLVSWGAGATKMPWRGYAVGSAVGLVPSAIGYAAAGTSLETLFRPGVAGWSVLALIAVVLVGHRVARAVRANDLGVPGWRTGLRGGASAAVGPQRPRAEDGRRPAGRG